MKTPFRRYGCSLSFLLISLFVYAQQLPVTIYSSREGDPLAGATSILQDKQGWIWFVNGYEVVRYDGHRFKSYPPTRDTKYDYVYGLIEVEDEKWVLGYSKPIKIAGDSVAFFSTIDPSLKFQHSIVHLEKTYLLEQKGLYVYENGSVRAVCSDSRIKAASEAQLTPFNDSILLSYDSKGALIVFNLNTHSAAAIGLQIEDMQQDVDGNIFLLVNGNEFYRLLNVRYDGAKWQVEKKIYYSLPEKNFRLSRFVIDRKRNIWASQTQKALVRLTPQFTFSVYTESQGLPSLLFQHLLIDREDNLWIAFNSGICKINTGLWERLTKSEGLVLNHVKFMTSDGKLIFLGTQDGINLYDKEKLATITQDQKPFVCNALLSGNSELWYARDSLLYNAYLDVDHAMVQNEMVVATLSGRITELKKDNHGTLFVATTNGVYAWYHHKLQKVIPDSIHYRKMVIDLRNEMWLGQFSGPVVHYAIEYGVGDLKVRSLQTINVPGTMPALETIRAMEMDSEGNIVVGTRFNGLFHLAVNDSKVVAIKHFGTDEGLSSKNIWGIACTGDGKIWVSTAMGLNSIRQEGGRWQVVDEGRRRNIYATSDVLYDKARQRIWVNNHPGVIYFDVNDSLASYPFRVHLSIRAPGDKGFNESERPTRFSHNENNFSFEFSTNSYQNEKAIEYTYRLVKSGSEAWSIPSPTHSINFSSLSPGKYEFHVKALNGNNEWSSNEAIYVFSILPPLWQRPWFICLALLSVAGVLYSIYRYRIRKMKELFEMRQLIASDLHDEIGSSLTSIHILSKISQINVKEDQQKAHSLLDKVIDQSNLIQQNMSDIVWAIRPDSDKMENMVRRMREHLNHCLEPKDISVDFVAAENLKSESLPMEHRRDFLLIFKEAVNNIAKYSQCTVARIRIDRSNGCIRMVIEDDGIGFDTDGSRTSSGIKNMQRRAESMQGSINIDSVLGGGTRIELVVPVTR